VIDLAHAKSLLAPSTHLTAPLPSGRQVQAIPIDDSSTRLGAPCVFAKLPHPIQKIFENFPVTDGLQVDSLIMFLRVLVRIRYMHLSEYIADIKEIAAALHQDTDEAIVVSTILDGLHLRQRNHLVFCVKPRDYAGLDSMCVYAHNIAHRNHEDTTVRTNYEETSQRRRPNISLLRVITRRSR
jgi:hypothetical protein